MLYTADGHYPFNSVWVGRSQNVLRTQIRYASDEQAMETVFNAFLFESTTLEKWQRYWDGTTWKNLNMGYNPTTPSDWYVVPTHAKGALDRLAARITVNTVPPTSPLEGDLWVDTN